MYPFHKALPVFFFLLVGMLNAQSLNFSMTGGMLLGNEKIQYKNGTVKKNSSAQQNGSGSVALAFSLPLKKSLRLGAEVGWNTFETSLDYDIQFLPTSTVKYDGRYQINQVYFAVVPEYRLLKFLFVNAGIGYFPDVNSRFTSGERFLPGDLGNTIENITGTNFKRENAIGYFAGLGICPNITKNLAFTANIRYTSSPVSTDSPDQIGLGFNSVNFNVGLMYKPKM